MIAATYMVCGCMDDANRLGPANENGSDASSSIQPQHRSAYSTAPDLTRKTRITAEQLNKFHTCEHMDRLSLIHI